MNVRLAKPFGVRVGELVDRLEALSYRHGRPQFAISYCIVPAESVFENEVTECARPRAQKGGKARDPGIIPCRRTCGRFCARGRAHSADARLEFLSCRMIPARRGTCSRLSASPAASFGLPAKVLKERCRLNFHDMFHLRTDF